MYSTEVIVRVIAAALMCGPRVYNGYSNPPDPLDELYDSMPEPDRPSAGEMRDMGYFEAVYEGDSGHPRWWVVTEKGKDLLR